MIFYVTGICKYNSLSFEFWFIDIWEREDEYKEDSRPGGECQ